MRIGTDTYSVEMVTTDDGGRVWAQYQEFLDVFSTEKAETLPPLRQLNHVINLEPDYKLQSGRIYKLLEFWLKRFKAYIEMNLALDFIERPSYSAATPILFAKNHGGGLWFCVDNWALNLGTGKDKYPLPLMLKLIDRVRDARIVSKVELRNSYHLMRIKDLNEFKTAFGTCDDQFENWVMHFGLTNPPTTFQEYINNSLWSYMDNFTLCFLGDILIYSTNEKQHENNIQKVLQQQHELGLYCKAEKCQFGVCEVGFLLSVIDLDAIGVELEFISMIQDWLTPESVRAM